MYFTKHPANPIYGGETTGTIFDVFVTRLGTGYRMDFSWRPQKALAVAFSDDGLKWTFPEKVMEHDPASGWEDDINRNGFIFHNDRYEMWYTGQAGGKSFIVAFQQGFHCRWQCNGKRPRNDHGKGNNHLAVVAVESLAFYNPDDEKQQHAHQRPDKCTSGQAEYLAEEQRGEHNEQN